MSAATATTDAAKIKSPVLERLEAAKAAKEARSSADLKADLDAKLAAAEARHEKTLDEIKTRAAAEVDHAKEVASKKPTPRKDDAADAADAAAGSSSSSAAAADAKPAATA